MISGRLVDLGVALIFLTPSPQDELSLHNESKPDWNKVIPFISVTLMTDTQCHDQIDHTMVSINLCNSRIEQISCAAACSFHLLIDTAQSERRKKSKLRIEGSF